MRGEHYIAIKRFDKKGLRPYVVVLMIVYDAAIKRRYFDKIT